MCHRAAVVVLALLAAGCGASPVGPTPPPVPPPTPPVTTTLLAVSRVLPGQGSQCELLSVPSPQPVEVVLRWTGDATLYLSVLRVPFGNVLSSDTTEWLARSSHSLPLGTERVALSLVSDQHGFCATQYGDTPQPYTLTVTATVAGLARH